MAGEAEKVNPTDGVDFELKVFESADGGLSINYAAYVAGPEPRKRFHPRTTHVVGMLVCAAIFVIVENFDSVRAELMGKVSKTEDGKDKKKR
jgi:hypothetical protein